MKSVSGKDWEEINVSERVIERIKISHNISTIQAKIVSSRYFSDTEIYSIKNDINFNNPFYKNNDFLETCKILKDNIDKDNKVLIIGDYDVDGCVSTSLMVNFLKKINVKVNFHIPDRVHDGYGASKELMIRLVSKNKPQLIIFLDCGSNAHDAIKYLKKNKIRSIIIDHHNIQKPYPLSNSLINPKKKILNNEYNYLCTAFLTYLLIDLYIIQNKLRFSFKSELIYVLIATVSDIMPLRGINRLLAINILKEFDLNKNFILDNLFKIFRIKKKIELDDLGYLVGPVFNSAGRLDKANQIVELLTTNSKQHALKIIENIYKLNLKRKLIESRCMDDLDFKNLSNQDGVIFIYKNDIPEGIIGIIASKIKEYFAKPCIVLTNSGNIIKGSARSTSDFNIGEYIHKATIKDIVISGGGHNLAAGVTLKKTNLSLFKNFIDNFYHKKKYNVSNIFINKFSLNSINKMFLNDINNLGPWGNGNDNPIFLIQNVKIIKYSLIKNKFISCYIKSNNKMFRAISFNPINSKISYQIKNSKKSLDILIKVKENKWNNKSSIQLEIIDIIDDTINT